MVQVNFLYIVHKGPPPPTHTENTLENVQSYRNFLKFFLFALTFEMYLWLNSMKLFKRNHERKL